MGSGSSKAKKAQVQAEEQAQTPVEGVYEQNGGDAEAADDARQVHSFPQKHDHVCPFLWLVGAYTVSPRGSNSNKEQVLLVYLLV